MIFCIDNAEKSEEIIKCIVESLSITETSLSKIVSLIIWEEIFSFRLF